MNAPTDIIECPLCLGAGELRRAEILDRLGVKDLARVAQLSAEEVFRLLQQKHSGENQQTWARFEAELTRRTGETELRHRSEIQSLTIQNADLKRRLEDHLREVAQLHERNQELELEMSKVARVGRREEMDFANEARTWTGVSVERVTRNGDYILAYRDETGSLMEPRMLIDNKDKSVITEGDLDKLIRDAKERSIPVAALVARTEDQLRQVDREYRWSRKDRVWILRTTRQWLPRDLDVLRPIFEQMRMHGFDFLERNTALSDEVRRTFADLDRIETELKKATKAISSASCLVGKYRVRLQELCETAVGTRAHTERDLPARRIV